MQEVLNLEFDSGSLDSIDTLLSSLGESGKTQNNIVKITGLSSSTVSRLVKQLLDYKIIASEYTLHSTPKKRNSGIQYYINDFYLNFYFQILSPLKSRIKKILRGFCLQQPVYIQKQGITYLDFQGKHLSDCSDMSLNRE